MKAKTVCVCYNNEKQRKGKKQMGDLQFLRCVEQKVAERKKWLKNFQHKPYSAKVKQLIALLSLKDNLEANVTDLVQKNYYCYSYSATIFKRETGITLNRYALTVKMLYAYHELISTEKKVTEISMEVGFASLSHFVRVFGIEYGVTPGKLRRLSKK